MTRRDWARAREEQQRMRIIRLLEKLADEDEKEQCPKCGRFFKGLAQHRGHCDGPD